MKLLILLSIAFAFVLVASGEQRPPSVNNPDPLQTQPKTGDQENNDENVEMDSENQEQESDEPKEDEEIVENDEDAKVVQGPRNSAERVVEQESEEHSEFFEGDIKLTPKQKKALKAAMSSNKKEAITGKSGLGVGVKWPNGRVPYVLASNYDQNRQDTLKKAIAEYTKKTCIRFVPKKSSDKHWIKFIIDDRKCYSYIGKIFWKDQPISIGNGCNYVGTCIHEMMHAIGFFHEQSRLDRDDHVEIIEDNIDTLTYGKDVVSNFEKYKRGQAETLGEPYDLDSVMHYQGTAFGKRDSRGRYMTTIRAKSNPNRQLGQRDGFSEGDLKQINMLYDCKDFL